MRRLVTVALLIAAGACGGVETPLVIPTPRPTPTPAPATLADLSATSVSPEADTAFGCRENVHGRVTIANAGGTSVAVNGVRKHTTVESGGCLPSDDFVYNEGLRFVTPHGTLVAMDGALYASGSGCCPDPDRCDGRTCGIRDTFAVLTGLGEVPAGSFAYRVTFQNCNGCAGGAVACRPVRLR